MKEKKTWWKEAVVYQIYPRSFADCDGDGIGDLNGITEHLDYLEMLGVDVLWLSPVYKSPNDDNGYDISDYKDIMDEFGTMDDFDRLLNEVHKRGMRLVMDLVVNHTSDEHAWFAESRKSRDNPYREYYIWRDGKEGGAPNNWGSCFGGPAWEYDDLTDQYYLHLFSKKQPDLNWENPKVRNEVYDMMRWWCDKGIDGFRMDVIAMISKDPELPDGPINDGIYGDFSSYVICGPRNHEYIQEMRREVLNHYDLLTVGEAGNIPEEDVIKFAGYDEKELNMIFQFEHTELVPGKVGKWTDVKPELPALRECLNRWQTRLEGKAWNSLYLDNHDQPRCVSRFGNDDPEYRELSAKMLATMIHMMKGTPYIYQGEEIGMTNAYFDSIEDYRDIEGLKSMDDYVQNGILTEEEMMSFLQEIGRDNARTPMQWSTDENAGFTTGKPWIKINPNYREINAAAAVEDKNSVFHYYRRLIELRHNYPVIVYGEFIPMMEDDEKIYAYRRELDDDCLYVLCNYTDREASIEQDFLPGSSNDILIGNYEEHEDGKLRPYEAIVWMKRM